MLGVEEMSKNKFAMTADDFPIELGTTYYFLTFDGQILPCTPKPQLGKNCIFEAKQLGFKKSDLRFEFVFIDPDDGGEVFRSMKASEVYRHIGTLKNRACQHVEDTMPRKHRRLSKVKNG